MFSGHCVMQNGAHSGTLRAMSEPVPPNKKGRSGAQPQWVAEEPAQQDSVPDSGKDGKASQNAREIGGPQGPEPTRFGDWERKGRCIDF